MIMPFQLIAVTLSLSRMQNTKGNVQAQIHSRQRSSVTTLRGNVFHTSCTNQATNAQ